MSEIRKVCVVLVDRANYGRLKPVLQAIKARPELELQIIAAGSMVLERFSRPVDRVIDDGFLVDSEIYIELEGSTPTTMAKSIGFSTIEFAGEFNRLKPDILLIIGDRYEALAAVIAAAYMNICIVHIQGGEVSGSIDESARHAISKFAHFHCPATKRSADYLVRMGEDPATILSIGCPSSDLARILENTFDKVLVKAHGSGALIDFTKPFILSVFHPTTTEYGGELNQMVQLMQALGDVKVQTLLLWPNIDAGSNHISKTIRVFRTLNESDWLRTIINLDPEEYMKVLSCAACAVGNSSSFVRDAGFFGTPVVLVGSRQDGREHGQHVLRVNPIKEQITDAILSQLANGRYSPSRLYGDGVVSERIAEALVNLDPYIQKQLFYVRENTYEGCR